MMPYYISLALSVLLGVGGQILLKYGANAGGDNLLRQFLAPQSVIGLGLYFLAALCYMYALRKLPVSVAFPMVSASYVVVALAAWWLFNEPLGAGKLAGIALVCAGVALISRHA